MLGHSLNLSEWEKNQTGPAAAESNTCAYYANILQFG